MMDLGISKETILKQLPFIEDVDKELKLMEKEEQDKFERFDKYQNSMGNEEKVNEEDEAEQENEA